MISWFERHNKLSWLITVLIAVIIFYISSIVFGPGVGGRSNIYAILYHILAFFFFAFFLMISLVKGKKKEIFILFAVFVAIAYGISDEVHQFFVPGRYSSVFDVFLNSVGILFAFMIYLINIEYRGRKFKNK